MDLSFLVYWAPLLVVQNASFTWVSRARNSGSDLYHGIAAVFSNGVWFVNFFILFEKIVEMIEAALIWPYIVPVFLVYVVSTVVGSVFAGSFLRRYVEKGARRVGFYEN